MRHCVRRGVVMCAAVGAIFAVPAAADVRLPAVFGDNMVLQRHMPIKIWGWADPDEEVTVTLFDQKVAVAADDQGKWLATLPALEAGGPFEVRIEGKNQLTLTNVLCGEVWLCSGQSNMQWPVAASNDADLEALAAEYPNIRLITVPQVGAQEPQDDFEGSWSVCTPATVRDFSAVGFFFGRQLHQTLQVPIGLVDNSWGGSACEAWIRHDLLAADEQYEPLLDRWSKMADELGQQEPIKAYDQSLAQWREDLLAARREGKPLPRRPGAPNSPLYQQGRPSNLYNGVLKPVIGLAIRGAIWYQGESNADRAYQYRDMFPLMIQSWRDEWGQGDFPFYWVQLADFRDEKPQPGESDWAELREAQTMTLSLPQTGEAVIIDIGEAQDIHPRNKQDVAKRLARWALAKQYGIEVPFRSPTYQSFETNDGRIVVTMDHVGGGLASFDVGELRGFAIAGEDRTFHWAQAKIAAPNQVQVWSDEVSNPVAVRYAWADNPVCNLRSKEGLPATPFRTDDWPGVTADNR